MPKILVIDDDRSIRHLVEHGLTGHFEFEVITAADGDEGLRAIESQEIAVCLLDVYLPQYHGLELFHKIRAIDSKMPVIFITGETTSEVAIEAMRAGAFDYLSKPLVLEQLRTLTRSAAEARMLMDQPVALPLDNGTAPGEQFVGKAKAMLEVYKAIGRVAEQNVTVLIRGESGAGKELVARALVNHSDRRDQVFMQVNCAAIPDQLLESELFGHEKGAFTGAEKRRVGRFEQCDGGTIFLDEVGDMSPVIQGKVLRLLQEQRFERVGGNEEISTDVRIIAATNRPLEQMVEDDVFREDLLYRLNGFTIQLPPLRDRREDIPALLEYFFRRAKVDMRKSNVEGLSPEALDSLVSYDWPGNVRQLQSVVRQSLLQTTGTVVGKDNLPDFICAPKEIPSANASSGEQLENDAISAPQISEQSEQFRAVAGESRDEQDKPVETVVHNSSQLTDDDFSVVKFVDARLAAGSTNIYEETIEQLERRLFMYVFQLTSGNQSKTAELLGITRGKVRDRISTFGIQLDHRVTANK